MPGHDNLRRDVAHQEADRETADLQIARNDAFTKYMNICAKLDEAHAAAYNRVYDALKDKE